MDYSPTYHNGFNGVLTYSANAAWFEQTGGTIDVNANVVFEVFNPGRQAFEMSLPVTPANGALIIGFGVDDAVTESVPVTVSRSLENPSRAYITWVVGVPGRRNMNLRFSYKA